MRRNALLAVTVALAGGCGGSDGGGSAIDAGQSDALPEGATGCPAQQPFDTTACSGPLVCMYGHATCCGTEYSFMTCRCQRGTFSCAQTVECNFQCPDAG